MSGATEGEGGGSAEPATRANILAAARYLAMRDGFASFSMEAVASRSGFCRRTVYNQFENREALYRSATQQMLEVMEERIDIELPDHLPLAAAIRLFCITVQEVMSTSEYREIVRAIERDGREAPWLERAFERRVIRPLRSRIELYLMSLMARGELEFRDPGVFCADLMATLEAATGGSWRRETAPFSLDEIVDVVIARLSGPGSRKIGRVRPALTEVQS